MPPCCAGMSTHCMTANAGLSLAGSPGKTSSQHSVCGGHAACVLGAAQSVLNARKSCAGQGEAGSRGGDEESAQCVFSTRWSWICITKVQMWVERHRVRIRIRADTTDSTCKR